MTKRVLIDLDIPTWQWLRHTAEARGMKLKPFLESALTRMAGNLSGGATLPPEPKTKKRVFTYEPEYEGQPPMGATPNPNDPDSQFLVPYYNVNYIEE